MKSCHRPYTTTFAVLAVLLLIGACSDDDNPLEPTDQTGHWEEATVASCDYELDRFFRLDLPPTHLGIDAATLGITRPDVPGRDESTARIDVQSVRVYRRVESPLESNDIQYLAATIDTSGVWDPAMIAAVTEQPDRWVLGDVWRPVEFTVLYTHHDQVRGLDLRVRLQHDDVVAVTYDVVDIMTEDLLFEVGDQPEDNDDPGLVVERQPYYRVKLLKPRQHDGFTYQYELRNVYHLGVRRIDVSTAALRIEGRHSGGDVTLHGAHGIPYLQVFGLDVETSSAMPGADGVADWHRPMFRLLDGLLLFPPDFPHPFDATEDRYRDYATAAGQPEFDWDNTWLDFGRTPEIYDWTTPPSDYQDYDTFQLVLRHWVVDPE